MNLWMKSEFARRVQITKSSLLTNTAARMLFVQQPRRLIEMVHVVTVQHTLLFLKTKRNAMLHTAISTRKKWLTVLVNHVPNTSSIPLIKSRVNRWYVMSMRKWIKMELVHFVSMRLYLQTENNVNTINANLINLFIEMVHVIHVHLIKYTKKIKKHAFWPHVENTRKWMKMVHAQYAHIR